MSKKVNPTAVGVFVVGAISIAAASVFIFGTEGLFDTKKDIVTYFQGDANGLIEGADVRVGGIKVGSVKLIRVVIDKNTGAKLIPVVMELSAEKLSAVQGETDAISGDYFSAEEIQKAIEQGFKATLKQESMLSGRLFVDLDVLPDKEGFFYEGTPIPELAEYVQVPSQIGVLEEVLAKMTESIAKLGDVKLVEVTENLNKLIVNVDGKITELDMKGISESVVSTLDEAQAVLENEDLKNALANLDKAMIEFRGLGTRLNNDNIDRTLERVAGTMEEARKTAKRVSAFVDPESPFATRLNQALSELDRAASSVREFSDYLRQNPNALVSGKKMP